MCVSIEQGQAEFRGRDKDLDRDLLKYVEESLVAGDLERRRDSLELDREPDGVKAPISLGSGVLDR